MVNLLGEVWEATDGWIARLGMRFLDMPRTHLHLYGKSGYRVGRKMGHITVTGDSVEDALAFAVAAREAATRVH